MFRIAACLALLSQAGDGPSYLDRIASQWTENLPIERNLGIYIGRKWVGQIQISVKAASEKTGASFEMTTKSESKILGKKIRSSSRALLNKNLGVTYGESTHEEPDRKILKTLSVKKNRWKLRTTENGETSEREGDAAPGMTWAVTFLPLFGAPESEATLVSLDGGGASCTLKAAADKVRINIKDTSIECRAVEIRLGNDPADLWLFDDEGRAVEFRHGRGMVRFRPVAPPEAGKDLAEKLELKESEQAVAGLFAAIKRNDRNGVAASFDFERLPEEMVPGYADLDPMTQKQVKEGLRNKMQADLLSPKMRDSLPDEGWMEDFLFSSAKTTQEATSAEVCLFNKTVWKLRKNDKGRWLIVGVQNK